MDIWKSLVKTALMGTGNGFTPPTAPEPLQDVLNGIPHEDGDAVLFSTAALIGLARVAGATPMKLEETEIASPVESMKMISVEAAAFLKRMLSGEHEAVLPEFLSLTASLKRIVPPETLPALLGLGKNKMRKPVLSVIGERGKWLANQNSEWSYTLERETTDAAWETGTRGERILLLERLRERDTKRALGLIQSTWEQDPPEERAAFVDTFSTGLSMEDEPFLETCLDDSRKEVREAALNLLIRLPQSGHARRMAARVELFLEYKVQKIGKDSLRVTLPDKVEAGAKRDGISGTIFDKKMGKNANLLAQMLSLTPPSIWNQNWNQPPERIFQAALKSEWKAALLIGWSLAAERSGDPEWAAAIADLMVRQAEGQELLSRVDLKTVVKSIQMEKFEALAKTSITKINDLNDNHPMLTLLEACDAPWSETLAHTVLTSLQRQAGKNHWRSMRALPGFALRVPVSLTETFTNGWPEDSKGWETWIDQFCTVLRFRRDMTDALRR